MSAEIFYGNKLSCDDWLFFHWFIGVEKLSLIAAAVATAFIIITTTNHIKR